ncbi:MAG: FtsW/RodA/SpoVE family cell cycle protein, partial [Planctomycetota bacterium]
TDDDDAPETDDDQASRGRQSPEGNDGEAHDVTRDAHTSSPPGTDVPGSPGFSLVAFASNTRAHLRTGARWFDDHAGAVLLVAAMVLVAIGSVLIFSSSSKVAMLSAATHDPAFFLKKHLLFVGVGLLGCLIGFCTPHRLLQKRAAIFYIGAIVLLVVVLIPGLGTAFNGARRWFRFGMIGFQPSDYAKLALVVALAHHFSLGRVRRLLPTFERGFIPFVAILAPVCGLILIEPDFGTTLFLTTVGVSMFLLAGGKARHIGMAALPLVLIMAMVVIVKFDHVKPRIEAWVNPDADPDGKGYQVRQSLIALGAGGTTGVGLGQSRQAMYYLPEESTDFIFAILGEEFGFLGVLLALGAYVVLVLAGLRIAARAPDRFGQLLAAGLTLLIGVQAAINVAVVTASVPNKGIALPFISFGGSLTFFYLVAVGMILGVARRVPEGALAPTGDDAPASAPTSQTSRTPAASARRPAFAFAAHGTGAPRFASRSNAALNLASDATDEGNIRARATDMPIVVDSRIVLSSRRLPLTERIDHDSDSTDAARRSA